MTLTTARFLLLFLLVAYLLRVGDCYAADDCNLVVSETKATQSVVNKKILERDDNDLMRKSSEKSSEYTRKRRMLMAREDYGASFVAFNADYKGPRHHPPKNN